MKVEIAVTRSCQHCGLLQEELKKLGVPHSIRYADEDEVFQRKYKIKGSPNILVDDELVFRGMPSLSELRNYFQGKS